MVEQDYLLSKAVGAIFEDSFLIDHVAMRGGTVLHKGHLPPARRYSEDIDLVLVGTRPSGHIKKALHRVLKPVLGNPSESVLADIHLAVRNLVAKSRILRTTYTYSPLSTDAALSHLKVEVNLSESRSFYPLVPIEVQVPDGTGGVRPVSVISYDLDEMLGTKLRALLQREHGRDLFDLWWAWTSTKDTTTPIRVDPERVGAAFRFYMRQEGSTFKASDVQRELERRMASRKFLADMDGFMPTGHKYSPRQACEEFCSVFLPYLDGS